MGLLLLRLLVDVLPLLLKEGAHAHPFISSENRRVLMALACNLISLIGHVAISGTNSWKTNDTHRPLDGLLMAL